MKKLIYFSVALLLTGFLAGCDVNDKFDGLDDIAKPKNVAKYTYTLADADYKTISDRALKLAANAIDSAKARSINTNKAFSIFAPASNYVHLLLNTKYPYGDLLSSANITYNYGNLSTSFSILNTADYQKVWNDSFLMYVEALTPATAPDIKMNSILKNKFPAANNGDYKFIEYNYSSIEASVNNVEYKYFFENFDSYTFATSSPYTKIGPEHGGWTQRDIVAGNEKGFYYGRVYSGNKYAQVTSNATGEKNDIFLVTKQIDLTQAIAPQFTFDATVGYWNANCLKVFITDSDKYNGNIAGLDTTTSWTWTEITSNFTFPETPTTGYGTLAPVGVADLTSYVGKKVYIAFKYSGDSRTATSPKITTTYQIDNVKVSEMRDALSVPSSEKQYLAYSFDGTDWIKQAGEIFYVLQAADYTAMGLPNYLASTDLVNYIPTFLKNKYPYALEGAARNIVYATSSGATNIARFVYTAGAWSSNTYRTTKTEQFVFTVDGWVFDPTVYYTMVTTDYNFVPVYVSGIDAIKKFADVTNTDNPPKYEEFYYGFSGRYGNVSFRLSYRNPYFYGKAYELPASADAELYALTTNEQKVALMWSRLEQGMNIFLQLRFPNAVPQVSGVDVYYNVKVKIYTPDGVTTSITDVYEYKYKCTAAGAPPTFEYISKTKM